MVNHKYIDAFCICAVMLAVMLTVGLMFGENLGIQRASQNPDYVNRLFDDSYVHSIDIQTDDWATLVENASKEEYICVSVSIDGERFSQVGLRAKGNNSLRLTKKYELSRYSLKLEFDHYISGGNYHGLDKFSLDASFQDSSYMKSYLTYDMMAFMGVPSPLCSYSWVTVNGEDWGLFLALEEPEEAFAHRNFGNNYGKLYKPDYQSLKEENADVALQYIDDDPNSYPGIFENAKFKTSNADKQRLIGALKTLSEGENLETAVDVDEVLRYFTVQVFVMNWDSYLGATGHNYFLYEDNGRLSILPWDYNLAFGTYALGMTNPIKDPTVLINYPINTPADGSVMRKRPLYYNLMKNNDYFHKYHAYFDVLIKDYFESGQFKVKLYKTKQMIAPYVKKDPTAFCSYEDHLLAVDTLEKICTLRAKSIRGQLSGKIPSTIRESQERPQAKLDASDINLYNLGDFDDLAGAKAKQQNALDRVLAKSYKK